MFSPFPWSRAALLLLPVVLLAAGPSRAAFDLSFVARIDYAVDAGPRLLDAGLVNDDEYPDLVVATDEGIAVLFGSPSATLSAPLTTTIPGRAHAFAVADVDADGQADVIAADKIDRRLRVLAGDGAGGFTLHGEIALDGRPTAVVAADLDADGDLDLVVSTDVALIAVEATRSGAFSAPRSLFTGEAFGPLFVDDVDGDGLPEIVAFRENQGTVRTFARSADGDYRVVAARELRTNVEAVVGADFDGDGRIDLAVVGRTGVALLAGGATGFGAPKPVYRSTGTRAVAAADFDGDGFADLAVADDVRRAAVVLLGRGDGDLRAAGGYNIGAGATALIAVDLDADGRPDLTTANRRSDSLTLLHNRGGALFAGALVFDVGDDPVAATPADLDGDGHLDVVVVDEGAGRIHLLLGNGRARFRQSDSIRVGRQSKAAVVAHLDADEHVDIAVANYASDDVAVLSGTGGGRFAAPILVAVGRGPSAITTIDANDDGVLDLAVANTLSDSVTVLVGDGRGLFPSALNLPVRDRPEYLIRGDVDGDGSDDLVAGRPGNERVTVLLRGEGGFSRERRIDRGLPIEPTTSADLDRDGYADLIVPRPRRDVVEILRGRPGEGLEPPREIPAGKRPVAVAVGDFNGDGLPDLVVVNRDSRTLMLLVNDSQPNSGEDDDVAAPTPTPAGAASPWRRPEAADQGAWKQPN